MSTYYFYLKDKSSEYWELGSGSWYPYYEDLLDVLQYSITHNQGFEKFLERIQKHKVFDGYCDDKDFVDEDTIKYFLKPLYKWGSTAPKNGVHELGVRLVDEYSMYEIAVQELCKKYGIKYEPSRLMSDSSSEKELKKLLKEKDEEDKIWDAYFVKKGSIWWQDYAYQEQGVSFERALSEMRNGTKVWRLINPDLKYWIVNNQITSTQDREEEHWGLKSEDVLAEDWTY